MLKYFAIGGLALLTLWFRFLYRKHMKTVRVHRRTRPHGSQWFEKPDEE